MGSISGGLSGIDHGDGQTWIGQGLATYSGKPLSYKGQWGSELQAGTLFGNNEGVMNPVGESIGLAGGEAPYWTADGNSLLAMGEFGTTVAYPGMAYLWNTPVTGSGDSATDGSSQFQGYTAGAWKTVLSTVIWWPSTPHRTAITGGCREIFRDPITKESTFGNQRVM
jgi:hypothetical protein